MSRRRNGHRVLVRYDRDISLIHFLPLATDSASEGVAFSLLLDGGDIYIDV